MTYTVSSGTLNSTIPSCWDKPKLSMSSLTQSHQVFFGHPLSNSFSFLRHAILTQLLSSLRSTCLNHLRLLFLIIKLTGSNPTCSLISSLSFVQLNPTLPSNHIHFCAIQLQFMIYIGSQVSLPLIRHYYNVGKAAFCLQYWRCGSCHTPVFTWRPYTSGCRSTGIECVTTQCRLHTVPLHSGDFWKLFCSSDNCINNINYCIVVLKCLHAPPR